MTPEEARMQAAMALSKILSENEIGHAFIGGFAVAALGHSRETSDVDVEIDVADATELRGRISRFLTEGDARFSLEYTKLVFTPADHPALRVPVETLPIGQLGLPRYLDVIQLEDSGIPILRPGILVLTKIKRCAALIESTRPQSMAKFRRDVSDIKYLLEWLDKHKETVDFAGYASLTMDRLYSATKDLVRYWKGAGKDELVHLMNSVLEGGDREKIVESVFKETEEV